jgi:hypothetical protein
MGTHLPISCRTIGHCLTSLSLWLTERIGSTPSKMRESCSLNGAMDSIGANESLRALAPPPRVAKIPPRHGACPMHTDPYGLPISMSSEDAAAYREGVDGVLAAWPGAAQASTGPSNPIRTCPRARSTRQNLTYGEVPAARTPRHRPKGNYPPPKPL